MTTPTLCSNQAPYSMRMLADITARMERIEAKLDVLAEEMLLNRIEEKFQMILSLLPKPSLVPTPPDEACRHGEVLARAIREVSR